MAEMPREPEKQEPQVSEERLAVKGHGPIRTSVPPERQSVEVKPMRYVLGIGIALAIAAMILAFLLTGGDSGQVSG